MAIPIRLRRIGRLADRRRACAGRCADEPARGQSPPRGSRDPSDLPLAPGAAPRGTAAGADFVSYRLQVGKGLNPQEWIQIGQQASSPVENGLLAAWDTSGLSGLYAVQLVVVRSDQRVETAVIQVTIVE